MVTYNFYNPGECHVMVDLETLALGPEAKVIEIGACEMFVPEGTIRKQLDILINPHRSIGEVSSDTIEFHKKTNPGLIECATATGQGSLEAWLEFHAFLTTLAGDRKLNIWTQGTDFDLPIIYKHYDWYVGCTPPWKYWDVWDARTVSKLWPSVKKDVPKSTHRALIDAIEQSMHIEKVINQGTIYG